MSGSGRYRVVPIAAESGMIELVRYSPSRQEEWNALIGRSRNGTFLFHRQYMDYHTDHFEDDSFLVMKRGKLEAVIPGNRDGGTFYSHQGLTYGGVISTEHILTRDMLEIFDRLRDVVRGQGCTTMVYKPVPAIYHIMPAEEELYALFRCGARLVSRQISSAIVRPRTIPLIESRKSGIRKAKQFDITVLESEDFEAFWEILSEALETRFGRKPVHSCQQIEMLHCRFPANIKLHVAVKDNRVVSGAVLYLTGKVVHVQYIASSEIGRQTGALDLLFDGLMNGVYANIPVFEFGTSTENGGQVLNENLIFQKEGFGGRGIVYDTYECTL
jgi:hypothetical protein